MPHYVIEIKGGDDLVKGLRTMAKEIEGGSTALLNTAAEAAQERLSGASPSFMGYLKSSFEVRNTGRDERWIGPGDAGPSSEYPTSEYAKYVEGGGGPVGTMPNVDDLATRLGLSKGDAFAFAKYLRNSGKAVREGSFFIRETAQEIAEMFNASVMAMLARVAK